MQQIFPIEMHQKQEQKYMSVPCLYLLGTCGHSNGASSFICATKYGIQEKEKIHRFPNYFNFPEDKTTAQVLIQKQNLNRPDIHLHWIYYYKFPLAPL